MNETRKEAIKRSEHWWYCDNIVNHPGEIGLLRMDFPRVFVLIRDYAEAYFADFEDFQEHIAEVNFFDPDDRDTADVEGILIDAWNFLSLQEEEEERQAEMYEDEDEL